MIQDLASSELEEDAVPQLISRKLAPQPSFRLSPQDLKAKSAQLAEEERLKRDEYENTILQKQRFAKKKLETRLKKKRLL